MVNGKDELTLDDKLKDRLFNFFSAVTNEKIASDYVETIEKDPRLVNMAQKFSDYRVRLVPNGSPTTLQVAYDPIIEEGKLGYLEGNSIARKLRHLGYDGIADIYDKTYHSRPMDHDGRVA